MQFLGPPPNGKNFYINALIDVFNDCEKNEIMKLLETYPGSLFIFPALWTKLTGVRAPQIFAYMKRKEVEYQQGPFRNQDGRLSIDSTAFGKDGVLSCNT
jgi:hypothetical protein